MNLNIAIQLIKDTFAEWNEDKVSRLAAALAYYTIFSLAPLLIIAIAIAGLVFGQEAAQNQIVGQIQGLVGREGAEAIQAMILNASRPGAGIVATIFGVVTLLFGASGLFAQLQDALNTIWEVTPRPRGIIGMIQDRFWSFSMVLGTGFLLLVSLILSAVLAGIATYLGSLMPGFVQLWTIVNFLVSFGVITILFALIYKVIPDAKVAWSDVWIGAIVTSFLFSIGRYLIGLYLGSSAIGSAYGAAGSFVIVLIWVYYSAQILLIGAEFTQVYATRYGSRIKPSKNAIPVSEASRLKQGMSRANVRSKHQRPQSNALTSQPSISENSFFRHATTAILGIVVLIADGFHHIQSHFSQRSKRRNRRR
jgi:membrane protein